MQYCHSEFTVVAPEAQRALSMVQAGTMRFSWHSICLWRCWQETLNAAQAHFCHRIYNGCSQDGCLLLTLTTASPPPAGPYGLYVSLPLSWRCHAVCVVQLRPSKHVLMSSVPG